MNFWTTKLSGQYAVMYSVLCIAASCLPLWFGKTKRAKAAGVGGVLVVLLSAPFAMLWPQWQEHRAAKERQQAARAYFKQRCASARLKIRRFVEDVEAVALPAVRAYGEVGREQNEPGAAMAHEPRAGSYLLGFLKPHGPGGTPLASGAPGYEYVVVSDSVVASGSYRRDGDHLVQEVARERAAPRYAVAFEDIVDPQERMYWIATTRFKILDVPNNEVIAEYDHVVLDPAQGGKSGYRTPWQRALPCPGAPKEIGENVGRDFAWKVLKPKGSSAQ